jgi:hypothetical protein
MRVGVLIPALSEGHTGLTRQPGQEWEPEALACWVRENRCITWITRTSAFLLDPGGFLTVK